MTWHLGVDENGLGPQLGPLIVTGVLAWIDSEAETSLAADPSAFLHDRLTDSKKIVSHGRMRLAEAWARVCCEQVLHRPALEPDDLIALLGLDSPENLSTACPASTRDQCWRPWHSSWQSDESDLHQAAEDLHRLQAAGVSVRWVRSVMVCTRQINQGLERGISRLDLDLQAMERLILEARRYAGEDLAAFCGKVGGIQRYASRFRLLAAHPATVLDESRDRSSYRLAGIGEVRFLQDAETKHPLIALASVIGKALREVWMEKISSFYREHISGLPQASGYNDPVTDRFVRMTAAWREEHGIDESCFRRRTVERNKGRSKRKR